MKDKTKKTPKKKNPYIIRVEGMAPITMELRVLAEDEDEAFEIFEKYPHRVQHLGPPQPNLNKLIKKRVAIKNMYTSIINWVKNF